MSECLHDQRAWEAFGYLCGTVSLGVLLLTIRDWARLLLAYAPRNRGRVVSRRRLKDGRVRLRVVFRDRARQLVGRESEWCSARTGERCSADLESWLGREVWPRLERQRLARESRQYADRLARPPEPTPEPIEESADDSDDLLDQLEAEQDEPSSAQQYDTETDSDEPLIHEAIT